MTSAPSAYADVQARAVVLDPQPLVAADELAVVVADQRAGQQVGLAQDLEAVADAEHRHPACRRPRSPRSSPARTGRSLRSGGSRRTRSRPGRTTASTPWRSWSPCQSATASWPPKRTARWASTSSSEPGKVTTPTFTASSTRVVLDVDLEVLDHRVGEQRLGHLGDLGEQVVGDLAVDLELEPLALADVGHPCEAQAGQGAEHRLALRVEDLWLGHDVDDDSGHGDSLAAVGIPRRVYPWPVSRFARAQCRR